MHRESRARFRNIELPDPESAKQETEVRFVINTIPGEILNGICEGAYPCELVFQSYFKIVNEDGTTDKTRLRKITSTDGTTRYFFTQKKGEGVTRMESEVEVPRSKKILELEEKSRHRSLEKIRIHIPLGNWYDSERVIELDVFLGELRGLVIAEVEFKGEKSDLQAKDFGENHPEWFGTNVTGVDPLGNAKLAKFGIPEDARELEGWHRVDISKIETAIAKLIASATVEPLRKAA